MAVRDALLERQSVRSGGRPDTAASAHRFAGRSTDAEPLLITVDPVRDTPAVMQRYAAVFAPRLIGLSGTPDEISQVEKEYHVYAPKHMTGPGQNDWCLKSLIPR